MATTLRVLALAIQLALNAFALSLVMGWSYSAFSPAHWPQIADITVLIGGALGVVVLGVIPVFVPSLCPDRDNHFARALLLTGWPLTVLSYVLNALRLIWFLGFIANIAFFAITLIQGVSIGLADIANRFDRRCEKGPV